MIPNFNASILPLHSIQNSIIESSSLIKPVIYTKTLYDLIFDFLVDDEIVNEQGCLNPQFQYLMPPKLREAQFNRLNEIMSTSFIIDSKKYLTFIPIPVQKLLETLGVSGVEFKIETALCEIFKALRLDSLEIVGGTVFWILGPEYMKDVAKQLEIPEELLNEDFFSEYASKAVDIDIRIHHSNPEKVINDICCFLATKLPLEFNKYDQTLKQEIIRNFAFTKYFKQKNNNDDYEMVSLTDQKGFSADLLIIKKLKRKKLFDHDGVNLIVSGFHLGALNISNKGLHIQSFILKLIKMLTAENFREIDITGASMLFAYLLKGWRYNSKELQDTLLETFFKSGSFTHLTKLIKNHFPNVENVEALLCFNVCIFLDSSKKLILNVVKELLPVTEPLQNNSALACFKNIMMLLNVSQEKQEKAKTEFNLITAYLQIFGKVFLGLKAHDKKELDVLKTYITKDSYFQIQFNSSNKPLHIILKDDITSALREILNSKDAINPILLGHLESFCKYFNFAKELNFECTVDEPVSNIPELIKAAFILLEKQETKQLGFYLLCYAGIADGNSRYLTHLIVNLFEILKTDNSLELRKNLINALVKYWVKTNPTTLLEEPIKNLFNHDSDNIVEQFCISFSQIQIMEVSGFIFKTWEEHHELFCISSTLDLIQSFKNESPLFALKILETLLVNPSIKLPNIISFETLAKITEKAIDNTPTYKQLPKLADINLFLIAIRHVIGIDSIRGFDLLKNFQEKKAMHNGFISILQTAEKEEKSKLILEWNKKFPINLKTLVKDIGDRLKLLIECIGHDLEVASAIVDILKILFKITKRNLNPIKAMIKPRLEWLCLNMLKEYINDPLETLSFYFTISEIFDPQILLNPLLIEHSAPLLQKILLSKKEPVKDLEQVTGFLNKFGVRNISKISYAEFQLYCEISRFSLDNGKAEITADFLKKIASYLIHNKELINQVIINRVFTCIDQLFKNKKFNETLSLLEYFEKTFKETTDFNVDERWKELLIQSEIEASKKLPIFIDKVSLFLKNKDMLKVVKETAIYLLNNPVNDTLQDILKLLQLYGLIDSNIIKNLRKNLLLINKKESTETVFNHLTKMGFTLTDLSCLFRPLSEVNSDLSALFLDEHLEIFKGQKSGEFVLEFMEGFLKLLNNKLIEPLKIQKALGFLDTMCMYCSIDPDKHYDIRLKYVESFIQLENIDFIDLIEKLIKLAEKTKNQETANPLLLLFSKGLKILKNKKLSQKVCENFLLFFIEKLEKNINCISLLPLFNILGDEISRAPLELYANLALKIIEEAPNVPPHKQSQSFVLIIPLLKKLIEICFKKSFFPEISNLLSSKFLKENEICALGGKLTNCLLKAVSLTPLDDRLESVLLIFRSELFTLKQDYEFKEENLKLAIDFLISLIFTHNNLQLFFTELAKITKTLLRYADPSSDIFNWPQFPYLTKNGIEFPTKPQKDEASIMKEKSYLFFLRLTEALTANFIHNKNRHQPLHFEIIIANIAHLSYLATFENHKEQVVEAALNFCYCMALMPDHAFNFYQTKIKPVILTMVIKGFLSDASSIKGFENIFKLAVITERPITSFKNLKLTDNFKATVIFNMLKQIVSFETKQSSVIALYYFNKHTELLLKEIGNQAHDLLNMLLETINQDFLHNLKLEVDEKLNLNDLD
jgi:hypothetical protein